MMIAESSVRHSVAETAKLDSDDDSRAKREALNALRQAERMNEIILDALHGDRQFRFRPSIFLDLNRAAIDGLDAYAGAFRPAGVKIGQSRHAPPGAHLVPSLVEDLCDYVNDHWNDKSSVHLACMVLWRVNWIHPFTDGNGRTARALSYVVLSIRSGFYLPGVKTLPEQIIEQRKAYYEALEASDTMFDERKSLAGEPSVVTQLETLIAGMLATQLKSTYDRAIG